MNEPRLKIGILGCGRVCEHYIDKILIPERVGNLFQVVACCDVDKNKSNNVAKVFSCKSYNNLEEFVKNKDIEVVLILTKSGQHFEHAKICLSNDLNVIVEKPLSLRIEHAEELINISSTKQRFCGPWRVAGPTNTDMT